MVLKESSSFPAAHTYTLTPHMHKRPAKLLRAPDRSQPSNATTNVIDDWRLFIMHERLPASEFRPLQASGTEKKKTILFQFRKR